MTRKIVFGAMIAALYAALTLLVYPWAFGPLQLRVAEALTVLPFLFPAAVPGLFVGCLLVNLIGGFGMLDIVFGSLATLIAGVMTAKIKNPYLAPLPPVLVNALVIGWVMTQAFIGTPDAQPYWVFALQVGGGQLLACYGLGLPLLLVLRKRLGGAPERWGLLGISRKQVDRKQVERKER